MHKAQSQKRIFEWVLIVIVSFSIVYGIVFSYFDLFSADLSKPIIYQGADDYELYVKAANILDSGWVLHSDRLAAPFSMDYCDFYSSLFDNFDNLILKIFCEITGEIFLASNLTFLSLFAMIILSTLYVLSEMKLNKCICMLGSITFATFPFIFLRNIGHFVLSAYQFVPLSFLLCYWLLVDENFGNIGKGFFRYKRNILSLIFIALISNNGTTYYTFFTAFFLGITAVSMAIKKKEVRYIFKIIPMGIEIICCFILNFLPWMIFSVKEGGINNFGAIRDWFEAEIHGLKLIQLFMPTNAHGIPWLKEKIYSYRQTAPLVAENYMVYIGILGIIGFIILFYHFFAKRQPVLSLLSELLVCGFLLGTIGGISSIISFWITPMLRGYNRISIFLGFFCIVSLCVTCQNCLEKAKRKNLSYLWICMMFIIGIFEQIPEKTYFSREESLALYQSDDAFIKSIESELPINAMVFQLPYHEYPEGGVQCNMLSYHPMNGYLLSDHLRWSYGAIRGRRTGWWYKYISSLNYEEMINCITRIGFSGLYIDGRAYEESEKEAMLDKLSKILDQMPRVSENGNLFFFNLCDYDLLATDTYLPSDIDNNTCIYDSGDLYYVNCIDSIEENVLMIYENGTVYGPYTELDQGNYHVIIYGKSLEKLDVRCTAQNGNVTIPLLNYQNNGSQITFDVNLEKQLSDVEFPLTNMEKVPAWFSGIILQKR